MKTVFIFLLITTIAVSCKPREISGKELDDKLKETVSDYLYKTHSPSVSFKINNVVYYTDVPKKTYICEFMVTMHSNGKDTTGIVGATIPNDFTKVFRSR